MKELKNSLILFLTLCFGIAVFFSCSEDKPEIEPEEEPSENELVIKAQTKSYGNTTEEEPYEFEPNDEIGVYVVKGDGSLLADGNYADNVKYVMAEDGTWQSETPVCLPDDGESLNFYAYYPYIISSSDYFSDDRQPHKLCYMVGDQSDDDNHRQSDVMSASCTNVTTLQDVELVFEHRFARILFALHAGADFLANDLMSADVKIITVSTGAALNLTTGLVRDPSGGSVADDIIPNGEWKISDENQNVLIGKKAFIAPQELATNRAYIEILIGSRVFTKKFKPAVPLNSGESRLLIISFDSDEVDITPWEHENPLPVIAEEDVYEPTRDDCIMELSIKSTNKKVDITLKEWTSYSFVIRWGDDSPPQRIRISEDNPEKIVITHTYSEEGTYDLCLSGNHCPYFSMAGNSSLKKIKQWGYLLVRSWDYSFANCSNLEFIASGIREGGGSFESTFENCTSLKTIPEDLFERSYSNIKSFDRTFYGCSGLESIPHNLFKNCVNASSFSETFYGCPITEIPAGLFSDCTNANSFDATFSYCEKLTTIPAGLFENCTKARSFRQTFRGCHYLKTIPENFFTNCFEAGSFYETFSNCPLESIPDNLFADCSKVTTFEGTFENCQLRYIPANLFANNKEVVSFENCFNGCSRIGSIPENLFRNNTKVRKFDYCFNSCSSLQSIPETLFDNNLKVENFSGTFGHCSNVRGTTPKTNGIELWMRSSYPEYPSEIDVTYCFEYCEGLDNYADIPEEAK